MYIHIENSASQQVDFFFPELHRDSSINQGQDTADEPGLGSGALWLS